MVKTQKLLDRVVKEFWPNSCDLCGSSKRPIITFRKKKYRHGVTLKCSVCGLTVSYFESDTIHHKKRWFKLPELFMFRIKKSNH